MQLLKMKFGMSGENRDAQGLRFFGDIDGRAMHLGIISEMFPEPEETPMIKHRRCTLWFNFQRLLAYEMAADYLSRLAELLRKKDYRIVISSLDDLVDDPSLEDEEGTAHEFSATDGTQIYNAAGGFSVTAEKIDESLKFSMGEIEAIRDLAVNFGRIIYGRMLEEHFPVVPGYGNVVVANSPSPGI